MVSSFTIVMPAFNAAPHIAAVLQEVREVAADIPVVVVDDGSTDATAQVVRGLPAVTCLQHARNRGKGAALQTGMRHAIERLQPQAVIFMDADGQHAPRELPKFISAYTQKRGNFIVGRRELVPGKMPWPRILSNRITSALVSRKIGHKIPDSQSGYRLVETALLQRIPRFRCTDYEFETELLIRAARAGARFYHVPIATIYGSETSHIRPVQDMVKFIKMYLTT